MNEKYNWNLKDIFENEEEFAKCKNEVYEALEKISEYKGILDSSEKIFECYSLYEKMSEKHQKLYAYGMLNYHLDMANQAGIKLFKEVENLDTEVDKKTAFMVPEITRTWRRNFKKLHRGKS